MRTSDIPGLGGVVAAWDPEPAGATAAADPVVQIARALCALTGCLRAAVLAYDPMTGALRGVGGHAIPAVDVRALRLQVHESPLALEAVFTCRPARAGAVSARPDRAAPLLGFRPALCLPLLADEELRGVAFLDLAPGGNAAASDDTLLELARLAALALEGVQLRTAPRAAVDDCANLAGALHDGVTQTLHRIAADASRLLDREPDGATSAALDQIVRLSRVGTAELREAFEVLASGKPTLLALGTALDDLVADVAARASLEIELELDDDLLDLNDAVADALYRACREGLANVERHARATWCRVRCRVDGGVAVASVEDDGIGSEGVAERGHFGLALLRGRFEALGGRVELRRRRPSGTVLCGRAPLPV